MNKIYTGVGDLEIPEDVSFKFKGISYLLAKNGFELRSGGAPGADTSFFTGCEKFGGCSSIYLPWRGFNGSKSNLYKVNEKDFNFCLKYVNYLPYLPQGSQKLLIRDCYQILSYDLKSPSDFVVCYTKDGKTKGGTSVVIKIAEEYGIPVFNFGKEDGEIEFKKFIKEFIS